MENLSKHAKIKNVGIISTGTIDDVVNDSNNYGYLVVCYVSGYKPPDAPPSASIVATIRIDLVSARPILEWVDRNFRATKIKEGNQWTNWY